MNLYDRFVLPRLIHLACGIKPIARQRRKVVPQAQGRVLGIGVGSGLNSSGEAAAGHLIVGKSASSVNGFPVMNSQLRHPGLTLRPIHRPTR